MCNGLPLKDVLEDGADEVEEDLNDDADEELDTNTLHLSDTETERNKKSMPLHELHIPLRYPRREMSYYRQKDRDGILLQVCFSVRGRVGQLRKCLHRHLLRR